MTAGPPTQSSSLSSSTVEVNAYGMRAKVVRGPSLWDRIRHAASRFRKIPCALVAGAAAACLPVPLATAVAVACWHLPKPYSPECTPAENIESVAAVALGVGSSDSKEPNALVNGKPIRMTPSEWEVPYAVRKWVTRVKLHFGAVTNKPADQLCVKRWLGEQMKAEDMRDTDARRIIPVVALLASVPDAADCLARAVEKSSVVAAMRHLVGDGPV